MRRHGREALADARVVRPAAEHRAEAPTSITLVGNLQDEVGCADDWSPACEASGLDPWDARTVEWMVPNPSPEYNFAVPPVVRSLDHFWHLKYDEDEEGRAVRKDDADEIVARIEYEQSNPESQIHLPNPSYFPLLVALGLPIIFYGVIYHEALWGKALMLVGVIITLSAVIGWGMEPHTATDRDYDPPTPEGGAELEVATHG